MLIKFGVKKDQPKNVIIPRTFLGSITFFCEPVKPGWVRSVL